MVGRVKLRTAGKDLDLLVALKRQFGTYKAAHTNLDLHTKGLAQDEFYRVTRGDARPEQVEIVRTAFDQYRVRMEHVFDLDPTTDKRKLTMLGVHIRAQLRQKGVDAARIETLLLQGTDAERDAIRDALWWLLGQDDPQSGADNERVCAH